MTASTSVRFTEEMLGHVSFGETDFDRGGSPRTGGSALKFHLTIEIDDMASFALDPGRSVTSRGYIVCDDLGGRLELERGVFNLFVDTAPGVKRMRYRLWFRDGVGHPLTLSGFKLVRNDAGFDLWRDTTTLFTVLLHGHVEIDEGAEVVAAGILRIRPRDFALQLTTFRTRGQRRGERLLGLARFGWVFAGQLAEIYLPGTRRHVDAQA